jgi:PPP family 3-phenylpropionic acid transporter
MPSTASAKGRFSAHYFLLFVLLATAVPYLQLILRALGFGPAEIGYLLGVWSLAGVGGPLLAAPLADRLGNRRLLLVVALVVLGLLLFPLSRAHSFWLAVPVVAGMGFALRTSLPLTDALAATELSDPVHEYGRVRLWGSVGFAVALLGIRIFRLVDESSAPAMIGAILVAAVVCVGSSLLLPEQTERRGSGPGAQMRADFDAAFWVFLLAAFFHSLGMSSHYSFFSLYLKDALGMEDAAWVWAVGALTEVPLFLLAGRVIGRFGLLPMFGAAMVAASARFCIYALVPQLWAVLPAQFLHFLCFGVFHAASIEFLRRKVGAVRRGLGMALYSSVAIGLPWWIGASVGGHVIERFGYSALYMGYAGAPLVGLAVLLAGRRRLSEAADEAAR